MTEATDAREAIRQADSAMYVAKRAGRDGCRFYEGTSPARAGRRLAMARALRGAEMRGEMRLVFQPVFELEARHRRRRGGAAALAPPGARRGRRRREFIPVAEESGAIIALGAWVLRESCEVIARAQRAGGPAARSVRQRLRPSAGTARLCQLRPPDPGPRAVPGGAADPGDHGDRAVSPDADAASALSQLESLGIGIVLDDFGTGYSSLSWLKHYPFSGIKIDRAFVAGIPQDHVNHAIVAGVIGMARAAGCTITAEGVETDAEFDALRALHCERGQGFLLARPMTAEALAARLDVR